MAFDDDDDDGPDFEGWGDELGDDFDNFTVDDDGNIIDTDTGEIVGNVEDFDSADDWADAFFGSYWDDVADLNPEY